MIGDKLRDSERQNELLRIRCTENEQIIDKFGEDVRQLEVMIDRKSREHEALGRDNQNLK